MPINNMREFLNGLVRREDSIYGETANHQEHLEAHREAENAYTRASEEQLNRILEAQTRNTLIYGEAIFNEFSEPIGIQSSFHGMTSLPGGMNIVSSPSIPERSSYFVSQDGWNTPQQISVNPTLASIEMVDKLEAKLAQLIEQIEELKTDNEYMKAILDEEFGIKTRG